MGFKTFSIFSAIIIVLVCLSSFVLGFIKTSTPLNQDKPIAFYVYDHSEVSTKITSENNPELFEKLCESFSNLTKINIASRLIQGGKLDEEPSQDISQTFGELTLNVIKFNHLALEVVWETKQQQIVNINGNHKLLEYFSCVLSIDETAPKMLALGLSQTVPESSASYKGSPMLVRGSTADIYNLLKNN